MLRISKAVVSGEKKYGADNTYEISICYKKDSTRVFYSEENGCLFKGDSLEVLKK